MAQFCVHLIDVSPCVCVWYIYIFGEVFRSLFFPHFPIPVSKNRANVRLSTLKCSNRNYRFVWLNSYFLVGQIHCFNHLNQNDLHRNPLLISVFIGHLGHSFPFTWCRINARILFQLKNEHNHELKIIINNYCFSTHLYIMCMCA